MSRNLTKEELHFPWVGADKEFLAGNTIIISSGIDVLLLIGFQKRQFQAHVLSEGLKKFINNQNTHYLPPSEFPF